MYSVLLLIASFGALAGLYIQLDAPFVAVAQIIIYAGAIMVLFLFVVMLLNAPQEDAAEWDRAHPLRQPGVARFGAAARGAPHRAARLGADARSPSWRRRSAARRGAATVELGARAGPRAVHRHAFAFEATSVLILVAMVGAVVLARREGESVIPLSHYLIVSAILFAIGTAGVFLRRNLITILLSIEIMLNAVNLTFVAFGRYRGDVDGQIITFFVMTVAAAEAAVGLALIIALFRHRESLNPDAFTSLNGDQAVPCVALDSVCSSRSLIGFLVNATLGRRLPKSVSGGLASLAMLASFAVSAMRVLAARRPAAGRARHRPDALHLDRVRTTSRSTLAFRARSAVGGDDPRRHRHRLADSHLLDRLHARRGRQRVRALLLVPEPVRGVHAGAGARRRTSR